MRYAVVEFIPNRRDPMKHEFKWVATDLSLSSANDAIKAWGYQASQKGGWMERIEDSQEAFDKWKSDRVRFYRPILLETK